MAYMYLVIQFCSSAYDSVSANAFVYRAARAYFYIIFNDHTTATVHFFILYFLVFTAFEIKRIRANHSSSMYNHIVTYNTMIIYSYIGVYQRIFSYPHMISYKNPWLYLCVFPNHCRI